jgi:hypothetical protein
MGLPPIAAIQSQLTVVDNFHMFGLSAWDKYDTCHSITDYQQVSKYSKKYLRSINISGSIKICK